MIAGEDENKLTVFILLLSGKASDSDSICVRIRPDSSVSTARQPDGFATTALKLSTYRKLNPGPLEEILFFDHPSGHSRILMAMQWKAEHLAEIAPAPAASR